jgi:hypothetical protein
MGGKIFANSITASGKPVVTPRMSPELYHKVSEVCQAKLDTLFDRVVIPRDAPDKKDHGDIDFLVGSVKPAATANGDLWSAIKKTLGAELYLRGGSHSFAIPHPEIEDAHIQVDVELSPGDGTPDAAELYQWTRFMKGDSDLLQIIALSHRSLGIHCNDRGMHVRVEEIEPRNKQLALLFLTCDPIKTMEFLGFDATKHAAGFHDETDLFDWATSGRFFSPTVYDKKVEKSNDRSRKAKRPMYARFSQEYMPAHPDRGASNAWTRKEVLDEALDTFDKRAQYDAMMAAHNANLAEEQLWREIKDILPPNGDSLKFAVKALRRWVVFEDGKPRISTTCSIKVPNWTPLMTADTKPAVLQWVTANWAEVKVLEKARAAAEKLAGLEEAKTAAETQAATES